MKKIVRLTSRRRLTVPAALCDDLKIGPGDEVELERRVLDGERVWILRPKVVPSMPWFGALRNYAAGRPHDMEAARAAIGRSIGRSEAWKRITKRIGIKNDKCSKSRFYRRRDVFRAAR